MALNHGPIFADKKVIDCARRFIQFVVYSTRNPVVYRTWCGLSRLFAKHHNLVPGVRFSVAGLDRAKFGLNRCESFFCCCCHSDIRSSA